MTAGVLRGEVAKARLYTPRLGEYHVASSSRSNPNVLTALVELNAAHRQESAFTIRVWFWDDIERELARRPQLAGRYFSGVGQAASLAVAGIVAAAEARLRLAVVTGPDLDAETVDAKALLVAGKGEACLDLLRRLRRRAWDDLPNASKSKVLILQAAACELLFDEQGCTEALFEAHRLSPDDAEVRRNLVAAYRVAGDEERARAEADRLASEQSHIAWTHALAIELSTTPEERERALDRVPGHLKAHAEVLLAVAKSWRTVEDVGSRLRNARAAADANPRDLEALCSVADSLALPEVLRFAEASGEAGPPDAGALAESVRYYSLAVDASTSQPPQAKAMVLLKRADALRFLGRRDEAAKDVRAAHKACPGSPRVVSEYAWLLLSERRWEEVLDLLSDARDHASEGIATIKALALRGRGAQGDVDEALGLLGGFAASSLPSLRLAVDICVGSERFVEGLSLLERSNVGEAEKRVQGALLRLASGDKEGAAREAQAVLVGGVGGLQRAESIVLGRVLARLGRCADACAVLRRAVFPGNDPNAEVLMACASDAGLHGEVARFGQAERDAGFWRPELLHIELRSLALFDLPKAAVVAAETARRFPKDHDASLIAAELAIFLGREAAAAEFLPSLPPPAEADGPRGAAVVACLLALGRGKEAVAYGYELARRNRRSPEALNAFANAILSRDTSGGEVPEREQVCQGCAVQLNEGGESHWWILQDSEDACVGEHDLPPSHPFAQALLGKRVGDAVGPPRGKRSATVAAITDKHTLLLRHDFSTGAQRFPDNHFVESFSVVDDAGEASFEPLFELLRQRADTARQRLDAYSTNPVPISLFASASRIDVLDAVAELCADPAAKVYCWNGGASGLDKMRHVLGEATELVVDLSALGTLRALGLLRLARSLRQRLVLPQAGAVVLAQRARRLETAPRKRAGSLSWDGERAVLMEENEASRAAASREAAELRDILSLASIEGCDALADEDDTRATALRVIGRASLEAAFIANRPGRLLWSDEGRCDGFAGFAPRVLRACSQVVLEGLCQQGALSPADFHAASAALVGFGYQFPILDAPILEVCGRIAEWAPERAPLREAIGLLASGYWAPDRAASLGAELSRAAYVAGRGPHVGAQLQAGLLDAFMAGPRPKDAITAFANKLVVGLELLPAAQERAMAVIQAWSTRASTKPWR